MNYQQLDRKIKKYNRKIQKCDSVNKKQIYERKLNHYFNVAQQGGALNPIDIEKESNNKDDITIRAKNISEKYEDKPDMGKLEAIKKIKDQFEQIKNISAQIKDIRTNLANYKNIANLNREAYIYIQEKLDAVIRSFDSITDEDLKIDLTDSINSLNMLAKDKPTTNLMVSALKQNQQQQNNNNNNNNQPEVPLDKSKKD